MIIVLKHADFSSSNIGLLKGWKINYNLGKGVTFSGPRHVEENASFTATIQINDNRYIFNTSNIVITMGSQTITSLASISNNKITINISQVTANINIMVPTLLDTSSLDADVNRFISTTGIVDATLANKLNDMVYSLKNKGLWSKIDALYPMVGDNFTQMSYNLKDPAMYQLRTTGSVNIIPNVGMSSTTQIQSDIPGLYGSDLHIFGSATDETSVQALYAPGPSCGSGYSGDGVLMLVGEGAGYGALLRTTFDNAWSNLSYSNTGPGLWMGSLSSGIVHNGRDIGATKSGNPSFSEGSLADGLTFCYNGFNSSHTPGEVLGGYTVRIAGFGKGLTIKEMETYSTIINDFKEIYESTNYDIDAQTFFTATNISDINTQKRVNTLVTSLKDEGLWDKIEALYPCVGTSFEQMSYNLKNPNTYKLTCLGTPTINTNRSVSCMGAIKSDTPTRTGSDFHVLGWSLTQKYNVESELLCPGPSNGAAYVPEEGGILSLVYGSDLILRTGAENNWTANFETPGNGLYIGSLTSGIVYNGINVNAVKSGNPSIVKWHPDRFTHNCYNSQYDLDLSLSPFEMGLSGFGYGLTVNEMMIYSQILNKFKNIY